MDQRFRSLVLQLASPRSNSVCHFLLEIARQFIFTRHIINILLTYSFERRFGTRARDVETLQQFAIEKALYHCLTG